MENFSYLCTVEQENELNNSKQLPKPNRNTTLYN